MKVGMYHKLNSALNLWFQQQCEERIPVTGPIVLEKATKFYSFLYPESPNKTFNTS